MKFLKSPKFKKYFFYGIAMLVMYLIQFTPFMISIGGVYFSPMLILTLCFASHETDFHTMIFSMICGMLVDVNSLCPIGFHAIVYMLLGVFVCLMNKFYFQRRFSTAFVISFFPIVLNAVLEWIVGTKLCENAVYLLTDFYLPSAIYSLVMFIPFYALFTLLFGFKRVNNKPRGVVPEKLEMVRRKYAARAARARKRAARVQKVK